GARERVHRPARPARVGHERSVQGLRRRDLLRHDARALPRHERAGCLFPEPPPVAPLHGAARLPVRGELGAVTISLPRPSAGTSLPRRCFITSRSTRPLAPPLSSWM